jgi:hypothetical protein
LRKNICGLRTILNITGFQVLEKLKAGVVVSHDTEKQVYIVNDDQNNTFTISEKNAIFVSLDSLSTT